MNKGFLNEFTISKKAKEEFSLSSDESSSNGEDSEKFKEDDMISEKEAIKRTCCMFYPQDRFKGAWDIYMSIILMFACIVTPVRISFYSKEVSFRWFVIDLVVDFFFFVDIIINFNTAFYDQDYNIIENRKSIACDYIKGWFFIDMIAVIPFDLIFESTNLNEFVRIMRIGRLYKLIKLLKLMRMLMFLMEKRKL